MAQELLDALVTTCVDQSTAGPATEEAPCDVVDSPLATASLASTSPDVTPRQGDSSVPAFLPAGVRPFASSSPVTPVSTSPTLLSPKREPSSQGGRSPVSDPLHTPQHVYSPMVTPPHTPRPAPLSPVPGDFPQAVVHYSVPPSEEGWPGAVEKERARLGAAQHKLNWSARYFDDLDNAYEASLLAADRSLSSLDTSRRDLPGIGSDSDARPWLPREGSGSDWDVGPRRRVILQGHDFSMIPPVADPAATLPRVSRVEPPAVFDAGSMSESSTSRPYEEMSGRASPLVVDPPAILTTPVAVLSSEETSSSREGASEGATALLLDPLAVTGLPGALIPPAEIKTEPTPRPARRASFDAAGRLVRPFPPPGDSIADAISISSDEEPEGDKENLPPTP